MIAHLRLRRLIDAHVDRELDGVVAGRVADHVQRCPRCAHDADLTVLIKSHLAISRFLPPRGDDSRS